MKTSFLPKTKLGRYSVVSILIAICLLAILFVMTTVFDFRGGDTFASDLPVAVPAFLFWTFGFAAFILGLIAVLRLKSRSILVFTSSILGLLILLQGFIEIATAH